MFVPMNLAGPSTKHVCIWAGAIQRFEPKSMNIESAFRIVPVILMMNLQVISGILGRGEIA